MEIKVNNINESSIGENKIIKSNCSFKEILKEKKKEIDNFTKEELSEKYDKSNNIKMFGRIMNLDMKKNKDKFTKENGKVDLKRILDEYGHKVDEKGLTELVKVLNAMHKEGLLDDEDYFKGLRWVERKVFEKSIKINMDKKKFKVIESLEKE